MTSCLCYRLNLFPDVCPAYTNQLSVLTLHINISPATITKYEHIVGTSRFLSSDFISQTAFHFSAPDSLLWRVLARDRVDPNSSAGPWFCRWWKFTVRRFCDSSILSLMPENSLPTFHSQSLEPRQFLCASKTSFRIRRTVPWCSCQRERVVHYLFAGTRLN